MAPKPKLEIRIDEKLTGPRGRKGAGPVKPGPIYSAEFVGKTPPLIVAPVAAEVAQKSMTDSGPGAAPGAAPGGGGGRRQPRPGRFRPGVAKGYVSPKADRLGLTPDQVKALRHKIATAPRPKASKGLYDPYEAPVAVVDKSSGTWSPIAAVKAGPAGLRLAEPAPRCQTPFKIKDRYGDAHDKPCGQCKPCVMRRRRQEAGALESEAATAACAEFLTLTFEDRPEDKAAGRRHPEAENPTGADGVMSMEALRSRLDRGDGWLKFFLVTERGPTTGRGHHHVAVFSNLDLRKPLRVSKRAARRHGDSDVPMLTSRHSEDMVNEVWWRHGGMTSDKMTSARAGYIPKYMLKDTFVHEADMSATAVRSLPKSATPEELQKARLEGRRQRSRFGSATRKASVDIHRAYDGKPPRRKVFEAKAAAAAEVGGMGGQMFFAKSRNIGADYAAKWGRDLARKGLAPQDPIYTTGSLGEDGAPNWYTFTRLNARVMVLAFTAEWAVCRPGQALPRSDWMERQFMRFDHGRKVVNGIRISAALDPDYERAQAWAPHAAWISATSTLARRAWVRTYGRTLWNAICVAARTALEAWREANPRPPGGHQLQAWCVARSDAREAAFEHALARHCFHDCLARRDAADLAQLQRRIEFRNKREPHVAAERRFLPSIKIEVIEGVWVEVARGFLGLMDSRGIEPGFVPWVDVCSDPAEGGRHVLGALDCALRLTRCDEGQALDPRLIRDVLARVLDARVLLGIEDTS